MEDQNPQAAALDELILRAAERGITDPEVIAQEIYDGSDEPLRHYVVSLGLQALMDRVPRRGGENG